MKRMSNKKLSILIIAFGNTLSLLIFLVLVLLERYTESVLALVLGTTASLSSSLIAVLSNAHTDVEHPHIKGVNNDNSTTKDINTDRNRTPKNKSELNDQKINNLGKK
jgi:hypothetical protein